MTLRYTKTLTSLNSAADKFAKELRDQATKPELMPLPIFDEHDDYPVITDILKKLRIGELTVIGGFQGHGKSLYAQQSAFYVANSFKAHNELVAKYLTTGEKDPSLGDDPKPLGVLYVSMEMPWTQLFGRALVQFHKYDPANLSDPTKMTEVEWQSLDKTVQQARDWPVVICDAGKVFVDELKDILDEVSEEFTIRMLVVDYLQLLSHAGHMDDPVQKLDDTCKQLKQLAMDRHLHVITPSSLSRDKGSYMPTSQQLRGSQAIAFNADQVMILHRPYVADPDLDVRWQDWAVLNIEKSRSAGTGQVRLKFDPKRLLFKTANPRTADELGALPSRSGFGGGF